MTHGTRIKIKIQYMNLTTFLSHTFFIILLPSNIELRPISIYEAFFLYWQILAYLYQAGQRFGMGFNVVIRTAMN